MGCDYYGNKDNGEMIVTYSVYKKGSNIPTKHVIKFEVHDGESVYVDTSGDIEER